MRLNALCSIAQLFGVVVSIVYSCHTANKAGAMIQLRFDDVDGCTERRVDSGVRATQIMQRPIENVRLLADAHLCIGPSH